MKVLAVTILFVRDSCLFMCSCEQVTMPGAVVGPVSTDMAYRCVVKLDLKRLDSTTKITTHDRTGMNPHNNQAARKANC